jgi:hypothetical protein
MAQYLRPIKFQKLNLYTLYDLSAKYLSDLNPSVEMEMQRKGAWYCCSTWQPWLLTDRGFSPPFVVTPSGGGVDLNQCFASVFGIKIISTELCPISSGIIKRNRISGRVRCVLVIVTMFTLAYILLWEGLSVSSYSFKCKFGGEMPVLSSSCAVCPMEGEVVWSKFTRLRL